MGVELKGSAGFLAGSGVKSLPANAGRSLGQEEPLEKGDGNRLQYSCLENPMDRGAWRAIQSMGSQRVGHD